MSRAKNPLKELARFGVSVWYDNISRSLLQSGALERMIGAGEVRGVTSNPTIFEKAIGGSTDYDDAIRRHARSCKTPMDLFEALAVEDIRAACDLFKGVYEESGRTDGFVSLEVAPALARDAEGTHREAVRLHALVARPNVMIKIPATKEGLAAIEATIADGIPVNVTLLFSQKRYIEVAEAYLRGLETRVKRGKDLKGLASVASFFVSRVDSAADKTLGAASPLAGRAAISNAKLAYQSYKTLFGSERFAALKKKGAQVQRLLWASTSTKNPAYRDVIYCEELIGADTVNTMPPATVDAFRDHGVCRPSLEEEVDRARSEWAALPKAGVDTDKLAVQLEEEGLKSFAQSFETLMGQLAAKRELVLAEADAVEEALAELRRARFSARLWQKDASLWKSDKEHQKIIKNSLGWLTAPEASAAGLSAVRAFVSEIKEEGFQRVVVLGMGGSSLACEVFRRCFTAAPGHPRLEVLDSTNPGEVADLDKRLPLDKTLFIVSSKSGGTIEPNCMLAYFWEKVLKSKGASAGRQFVAITDPGTSLEALARSRAFRKVFLNPADVGGRFSALTYFGLVPAALMGVDTARLLERARQTARACAPEAGDHQAAAYRLGAALGRHARGGRDKLTLVLPAALDAFGLWIEQLVAESTGKEGKGIVPVLGEPLSAPAAYADDRVFVQLKLKGAEDLASAALAALEKAGHPVLTLELEDAYDLGAQFLVWEIATAAAGLLLAVNPFDQPDVQKAKDQTKALLGQLEKGALPKETASFRAGGMAAVADAELVSGLRADPGKDLPLREALAAHLGRLRPNGYCAILAYAQASDETRRALEDLQGRLRAALKAPVLLQWGPRYLHSTGQLYKGGGAGGVFLELVEPDRASLPVPGEPYTFGTLHRAQARGDGAALLEGGRQLLRLELGAPGAQPLQALANAAAGLGEACRS